MDIRVNYEAYNAKRYGRPWISKVTEWAEGQNPKVEFGSYVGDDNGGYVTISADPGDIIRHGQKDNRQPKNNTYDWYMVKETGVLTPIKVTEARDIFLDNQYRKTMTADNKTFTFDEDEIKAFTEGLTASIELIEEKLDWLRIDGAKIRADGTTRGVDPEQLDKFNKALNAMTYLREQITA